MLEILRGDLEEPARLDFEDLTHVFFSRHHKLVVDDPFWVPLKQRRGRVNVNLLIVGDGPIPIRLVLAASVIEKAGGDSLPDGVIVIAA